MITSFQSKTGWEKSRKSDNKNYRSNHFLPDPLQRIPKNSKKLKKNEKKNTIMAPFEAKIGWKRQRKSENKNYRSDPFLPDAKQKISNALQKNSKN